MTELNLPPCELQVRDEEGKTYVFDVLRRRFVRLSPEEWVRQHFIHYLLGDCSYPKALMANEQFLKVEELKRRSDTVVYDRQLKALMLLEYKAPTVKLGQTVIEQVLLYNRTLRVPCIVISNGLEHYAYRLNYSDLSYEALDSIPTYEELLAMQSN